MIFEFNRYSGLLLVFFIHGLVYSILLWRKGILNDRASDKWLAAFLFLCILYVSPWMLGFAGWYEGFTCLPCRNFMFYMPLQHTLLMGPCIFFYVRTLFQTTYKFKKLDKLHFVPSSLYIVWCLVVFVIDQVILKKYYLMNGRSDPDFDDWYILAGLISFLFYLVLSFRDYSQYKLFIEQQFSFADSIKFRWVRNFLVACFIYFFLNLSFHIVQIFGVEVNYTTNWWYYLLFGILLYYMAINGYTHSIETRQHFGMELLFFKSPALLMAPKPGPIATTEDINFETIENAEATERSKTEMNGWKDKVLKAVVDEKLYANPELTLTHLAKHLDTNTTQLSKIINAGFSMNFNDFINYYRVLEVQQKLKAEGAGQFTIMSLAYDAGFNSKATFNRAFKKVTAKNPRDFISS